MDQTARLFADNELQSLIQDAEELVKDAHPGHDRALVDRVLPKLVCWHQKPVPSNTQPPFRRRF